MKKYKLTHIYRQRTFVFHSVVARSDNKDYLRKKAKEIDSSLPIYEYGYMDRMFKRFLRKPESHFLISETDV